MLKLKERRIIKRMEAAAMSGFSAALRADDLPSINDARKALSRVTRFGTPEEKAKVKRAVYAKYPSLKPSAEASRESCAVLEAVATLEAIEEPAETESKEAAATKKSGVVKVILMTEGLGNRRDLNYYGPEAISSMPGVFEGAPMMVDHPSYSEERDIPEGRVGKTVGYYKNLHVESVDGKMACAGEAHFDLSDEGQNAFKKALSAIQYKKEFPGSDREYIGISVNAAGESDPRTMLIDGEQLEVNYVTRFVEARSADQVTIPARGGKYVAAVESTSGAHKYNKEVRTMFVKELEKAQKALKEAQSEKDADLRKKKTSEAQTVIDSMIKEAKEAEAAEAKETERLEAEAAAKEAAAKAEEAGKVKHDPEDKSCECEACKDDDGDEDDMKKEKKGKESDDAMEASRLAVESVIGKSGLNVKYFDVDELCAGRSPQEAVAEAKREVARTKRIHEAQAEDILKNFGTDITAAHRVRENGAGGKEIEPSNNSAFPTVTL